MENLLKNENSPYLRQHENNPVNWLAWNKETLIKAKKSRNHTELLPKYLKLPIKIQSKKNFDLIKIHIIRSNLLCV